MMKKMIHTALYLETKKGRSQKLPDQNSRSPDGDPCTSNIWIPASARLMYRKRFSHLSRGVLMAVMVLSGWSSAGVIREVLGLKNTDNSCINVLESATLAPMLDLI